jgi:hypothetical protein
MKEGVRPHMPQIDLRSAATVESWHVMSERTIPRLPQIDLRTAGDVDLRHTSGLGQQDGCGKIPRAAEAATGSRA